jgi:hypothetical protein
MAIAGDAGLRDHVDVRVDAAIQGIGIADLQNLGGMGGPIDQVMAIDFPAPEGHAIAAAG